MKLKPMHNHVVIKQQEVSEEKFGNIIIPDVGNELPKIGTVVATGPGTYTISGTQIPVQSQVGQKVAFPSFGGTKFTVEGEEFVVIKDQDILTVIED